METEKMEEILDQKWIEMNQELTETQENIKNAQEKSSSYKISFLLQIRLQR